MPNIFTYTFEKEMQTWTAVSEIVVDKTENEYNLSITFCNQEVEVANLSDDEKHLFETITTALSNRLHSLEETLKHKTDLFKFFFDEQDASISFKQTPDPQNNRLKINVTCNNKNLLAHICHILLQHIRSDAKIHEQISNACSWDNYELTPDIIHQKFAKYLLNNAEQIRIIDLIVAETFTTGEMDNLFFLDTLLMSYLQHPNPLIDKKALQQQAEFVKSALDEVMQCKGTNYEALKKEFNANIQALFVHLGNALSHFNTFTGNSKSLQQFKNEINRFMSKFAQAMVSQSFIHTNSVSELSDLQNAGNAFYEIIKKRNPGKAISIDKRINTFNIACEQAKALLQPFQAPQIEYSIPANKPVAFVPGAALSRSQDTPKQKNTPKPLHKRSLSY